jgi:hypothetical protein
MRNTDVYLFTWQKELWLWTYVIYTCTGRANLYPCMLYQTRRVTVSLTARFRVGLRPPVVNLNIENQLSLKGNTEKRIRRSTE